MSYDKIKTCAICGIKFKGFAYSAKPFAEGECCDTCYFRKVEPFRLKLFQLKNLKRRVIK